MTKIKIRAAGKPTIANPAAPRGYAGDCPIVEVVDDEGVQPAAVLAAYQRCIVLPIMHATTPIPWPAIKDARQGQIVRLVA